MKNYLTALLALSFMMSCAAPKKIGSYSNLTQEDYEKLVQKWTRSEKKYSGLYNVYQVSATLMTSKLRFAVLDKMKEIKQWDPLRLEKERKKILSENNSISKVYLSLFTPEKSHNDLVEPNSIWTVYLEYKGQKYPAKIKKTHLKFIEIKSILPHHTRWSKAYMLTFEVPMSQLESDSPRLVLSSFLGKTVLVF
ncbi:MAG: hypothetical protein D6797_07600 [Bdellovibrio sp.]|nr:MAG: hypothetical protein D6797_07600 [Bdellovibrio sp.]